MRLLPALLLMLCRAAALQAQERTERLVPGKPLVTHIATFDAAAHVFNGRLYIYASHDTAAHAGTDSSGHYHLLRLDSAFGSVRDLGTVLRPGEVRWGPDGLGAPDAAERDGRYYLYFPAHDTKTGATRIGVACSASPEGPFRAEPEPVYGGRGTGPAVFRDDDGRQYLYYSAAAEPRPGMASKGVFSYGAAPELRVARLNADMRSLAELPSAVIVNDSSGTPLAAGDQLRRFAGGAWLHKYRERYYLSYSTGNSHRLVYATSRNPYGPFTYRGVLLPPVAGWTTRGSIVSFLGHWYLFYYECNLFGGQAPRRSVKLAEIGYDAQGRMRVMDY